MLALRNKNNETKERVSLEDEEFEPFDRACKLEVGHRIKVEPERLGGNLGDNKRGESEKDLRGRVVSCVFG